MVKTKIPKVKFIPKHRKMTCWVCNGKGCQKCNNTGKFVETFWYLIYTDKKGQKMAFGTDGLK